MKSYASSRSICKLCCRPLQLLWRRGLSTTLPDGKVEHLAKLSRIPLKRGTPEFEKTKRNLNSMVKLLSTLRQYKGACEQLAMAVQAASPQARLWSSSRSSLRMSELRSMSHPVASNRSFEVVDKPKLLALAKQSKGGYYSVPKMMGDDDSEQ